MRLPLGKDYVFLHLIGWFGGGGTMCAVLCLEHLAASGIHVHRWLDLYAQRFWYLFQFICLFSSSCIFHYFLHLLFLVLSSSTWPSLVLSCFLCLLIGSLSSHGTYVFFDLLYVFSGILSLLIDFSSILCLLIFDEFS